MTRTPGQNDPPTLDSTRVRVLHVDPGELLVVRGDQVVTIGGPAAEQLGRHVAEVGKVPPDEREAFVLEEGFFSACVRGLARQIKPTTGAAAAKGRRV